ncbi:MAG: bifunctional riboflavin kinase/FAD synthetase [Acidimicrobiia bacterium]
MKVLDGSYQSWDRIDAPTTLTLGVFDGVHLGHRELLVRAFKHDGIPAVVTFDPHPVEVLAPGTSPRLITTIDERLELLEETGVELVAVLNLAEVRHFSPQQFLDEILVGRLNVAAMTIGEDFQFGKDRAGDASFLADAGGRAGFDVDAVGIISEGGQLVSSSRIRSLIEVGSVADAATLLGSRYRVTGPVVDGDKRGRDIGYPTANIRPPDRKVTPGDGVYATVTRVGQDEYMSATNVGTRPTFGGGERLIEAHILNFEGDIYGEDVTIEFVERLRPELEFKSVAELLEHMEDDVKRSREILTPVMG